MKFSPPLVISSALLIALCSAPEARSQGSKIAFMASPGSDYDLYLMNPDGSAVELLSDASVPGAEDVQPAWSRTGRYLAFASDRDGDPEISSVYPWFRFDLLPISPVCTPKTPPHPHP